MRTIYVQSVFLLNFYPAKFLTRITNAPTRLLIYLYSKCIQFQLPFKKHLSNVLYWKIHS